MLSSADATQFQCLRTLQLSASFSLSSFLQRLWLLNNPTPKPLKAVVIPIQLSTHPSPPARFTRQDGSPTTPGRMSACLCVSFCLRGISPSAQMAGFLMPATVPGGCKQPCLHKKGLLFRWQPTNPKPKQLIASKTNGQPGPVPPTA